MASRADRYHTGDEDGNHRKMVAAIEPRAAKQRSSRLRWGAAEYVFLSMQVTCIAWNETYDGRQCLP